LLPKATIIVSSDNKTKQNQCKAKRHNILSTDTGVAAVGPDAICGTAAAWFHVVDYAC
jgi:hypothetical protein